MLIKKSVVLQRCKCRAEIAASSNLMINYVCGLSRFAYHTTTDLTYFVDALLQVILTVRDPADWVKSCRSTTMSDPMLRPPTMGERILYWLKGIAGLPELHHVMFATALGTDYRTYTDAQLRQAYVRWNQQVVQTVPPERLLIYNVKDGWEPLCTFLGVPVPEEGEESFPHLNKRHQMRQSMQKLFRRGRVLHLTVLLAPAVLCISLVCLTIHQYLS